jgi:AraC family transcriptional regulator
MTGRLAFGSVHGRELRAQEVAGFRLEEWTYDPDFQFPRHSHECAFLNLPLHGSYTEEYGRRTRTGQPLTLVLQPAGEVHAKHFQCAGCQTFDITITPRWLERIRELGLNLDGPAEFSGGLPVWLVLRLYKEFQANDAAAQLAIEGLLIELLAEVSRPTVRVAEHRPPRWLHQARELLHSRFAESLSLDEIAGAVGVHPDHLARVFRQQFH